MLHHHAPSRSLSSAASVLLILAAGVAAPADDATIHFDRDIRPILSDNCYACHGPDEQARSSELRLDRRDGAMAELDGHFAVVAGKPEESELIRRILSTDPDEVMPPPDHLKQLTAEQKQQLVDWVQQGAEWSDQWAWSAPARIDPPSVNDAAWPQNWVDQFILARLEKEDISPSAPADRRTLIRRLSFDLLGLPPTPEQVDAFVSDTADGATERLVDQLLQSPRFGERMAVYWLDLVRYADTVGYHGDQDVSVSPYRDYVINAFNANMPFNQFTREQLGGDLLPDPTTQQLVASGYNKLGMMSAEGGVQPKEYLAKYAADRVRTAGTVWLGVTMGCAECHDHKFDPFTTKDFYRFAAFFADIKERGLYSGAHADGNWGPRVTVPDEELPDLLRPVQQEISQLTEVLKTPTPELATAQQEWEHSLLQSRTDWQPVTVVEATALHDSQLTAQDDGSLLASGPAGDTNTYTLTIRTSLKQVTGLRLEVLPDPSFPNQGPGRAADGNFVLTELVLSAKEEGLPLQNAQADFEQSAAAEKNPWKKWAAASVIDGDAKGGTWGWAVAPQFDRPHNLIVELTEPSASQDYTLRLEQNHESPNFSLGRFRIWLTSAERPLKLDPIMTLPSGIREILLTDAASRSAEQQEQLAVHYRSIAPLLKPSREKLAALHEQEKKITADHTRTSLMTVAVEPREMRVLPRGNWMDMSGDVVAPGVPQFLPQIETAERASRLDLADWLVSEQNPLTARVFVNRLWKLYFGTGISRVLDDVGSQGEAPVHPELLDTLAVEFVESGWDVKHMVRLIVNSAAYQQSSMPRPDLQDRDPFSRLVARQSRFRLDAEFIRDNALSVSGLLIHQLGGRSVKPYQPAGLYRHLNFPARKYQQDSGTNQYRRGVYTHWQRQFLHPAMKSFDAPAREECTAERPRSNTPLAALVLLNDPSYVEAARVFAESSLQHGGVSDQERIDWILQQALSRNSRDQESQVLSSLLSSQRQYFEADPSRATQLITTGLRPPRKELDPAELAAWTSVTRAVFNMHEFIARN